MTRGVSPALLVRIAALAVVVVFFQIGVVSEVPVFGLSVDLSPLLVAFVGLLCGSMVGAVSGFAVGLLVDLALMQTLGVSSLIFTVIGYSLVEFLLGVDAPVSFELVRQIVLGVVVDTIVALPMWAIVRRSLEGALPDDPRRRHRRAYTTGGL